MSERNGKRGTEKPNWTQVPNSLLDNMPSFKERELRVLLAVVRQTVGWHKERDKLSISFLCSKTGLSVPSVVLATKELVERGLLERFPDGDSFQYELLCAAETSSQASKATLDPLLSNFRPPSKATLDPPLKLLKRQNKGLNKDLKKGERLRPSSEQNAQVPKSPPPAQEDGLTLPPEAEAWNRLCGGIGKVARVGPSRMKHLKARRKDPYWAANLEAALRKVAASAFLRGENDRGWRADFTWLIQRPDALEKVMEGKYDDHERVRSNHRPRSEYDEFVPY